MGNPKVISLPQSALSSFQSSFFQLQHFNTADIPDTVSRRQTLGDQCSDSCSLHAPVEFHDKQKIQHNIGQRGNDHGDQRLPAIAKSPQYRRGQVVCHDNGQARKQNPQIGHGDWADFFRRPKQGYHCPGCALADQGQKDCTQSGQHNGIGNHLTQLSVFTRTELLGHQDRKTLRKALDGAQRQPIEPVHCSQSRQRIHPQHLAHHGSIHHGIHLLENISRHQGQRKQKQKLPGTSLRQCIGICFLPKSGLFHSFPNSSLVSPAYPSITSKSIITANPRIIPMVAE